MTSKQKLLIANVAILIVAALAVWMLFRNGSHGSPSGARPAPSARSPRLAGSAAAPAPGARAAPDDDPVGPLLLDGQVLDPDGRPAGGATVLLSSRSWRSPRAATTEADGSFSFERLVPRSYTLTARRGDAIAGPMDRALTAASDPIVLRLVVGAVIEATVVQADRGAPIAGATVVVGRDVASATTGADGVARVVGVPRGLMTGVRATAPGLAPGSTVLSIPDAAGAVVTARIALHAGAAVSGIVVEAGGRPVAGASVAPEAAEDPMVGFVPDQPTLTDAAGRFHIPALEPGTYRFRARHRGHLDGVTPPRAVGAPLTDVRIELARGARVSGRVVDRTGAPAPWATVKLGASQPNEQRGERHGQRASADQAGAFVLEGVPPRMFSVVAASDEATSQPVEVDLARGDREGLVLRLEVDGRIAGTVVDDAGRPVAEAVVQAIPDFFAGPVSDGLQLGGTAQVTSDGDGRFLLRGRPPGKYLLLAGRTGNEHQNPLEVGVKAATGDRAVRLMVRSPGVVRGRVRFADGGAPTSFTVAIGHRPPLAISSRAGEFVIPEVDPGARHLVVRGQGFAPASRSVDVVAGAETDAGVIVLDRGRTLRGRVLTDGRPVAAAVVVAGSSLYAGAGSLALPEGAYQLSPMRHTTTDGEGRFELAGLEPGDVVVVAEHERAGRSPAVTAPAGDDRAVDLHLAAFAGVFGTVTRNGRPSGGLVSVMQRASRFQTGFDAAEDGVYDLPRLAAGEYTITGPINHHPGEQTVSRTVRLEPGQRLQVDLAVDDVAPSLTVSLKPADDRPIEMAHVSLVTGTVSPTSVREMTELELGPSSVRHGMPTTGESRFAGLRPGPYSVCVTPMPRDVSDPVATARFFEHPERVPVRCAPLTVAPAPPEQRFVAVAPAMPPP